jgi:hypothetical protein
MDKQGACTAMDPTMAYHLCEPPTKSSAITTTEATVSVLFTAFAAGKASYEGAEALISRRILVPV